MQCNKSRNENFRVIEHNTNENTLSWNKWNTVEAALRENVISISSQINKESESSK